MLAVTAFISSGSVVIGGDAFDNHVIVQQVADTIEVNVVDQGTFEFDAADVSSLRFIGRAGDDIFTNQTDILAIAAGNNGNDQLTSSNGNDQLFGGAGDDVLISSGGDNLLNGGNGNDTITGGFGMDRIFGISGINIVNSGAGDDNIVGGSGADSINAGDGNDTVFALNGNDTINGGNGDDTLVGGNNDDTINGGEGDDTLFASSGNDTVRGNAGNDFVFGQAGIDDLFGDAGDDVIRGGTEGDTISGGVGNDRVFGEAGSDEINGNEGNDTIFGNEDNDTIFGDAGQDFLLGGLGNDTIRGGDQTDILRGNGGNDLLFGDAGNDRVAGDDGDDFLDGGIGRNIILGDAGTDELVGNGSDFVRGGAGDDLITLNSVVGDTVSFLGSDSNFVVTAAGDALNVRDTTGAEGLDFVVGADWISFSDQTRAAEADVTAQVIIQPIIASNSNGSNTAEFFGNAEQEATIKRLIDEIYLQANIDIEFATPVSVNNTFINVGNSGSRSANDLNSVVDLGDSLGVGSSNPLVIDAYFVEISAGFGNQSNNIANGLAFVDGNGTTIHVGDNLPTFASGRDVVAQVVAHEIAHNLGLEHVEIPGNLLEQGDQLNASQQAAIQSSQFAQSSSGTSQSANPNIDTSGTIIQDFGELRIVVNEDGSGTA